MNDNFLVVLYVWMVPANGRYVGYLEQLDPRKAATRRWLRQGLIEVSKQMSLPIEFDGVREDGL